MNYIGSKKKLLPFITDTILNTIKIDISNSIFCDLFAGTGIVGIEFKSKAKKIISNDIEYYSYILNRNYIGNNTQIHNTYEFLNILNNLTPVEGFIYNNYCLGSGSNRQYYSDYNGKKIDAIIQKIKEWKEKEEIGDDLYYFLLASLIESADKVANTASVYGAYLKHLKNTAKKSIILSPASFEITKNKHDVYNNNGNVLIKQISGDILYLDPPYNTRQYGANYHLLNTITLNDDFIPKGKTGLRNYNRSEYCSKKSVYNSFNELIKNSNFKYIFLSYNNEGLMSVEDIRNIMKQYGKYDIKKKKYQRFRSDKQNNRNHKADYTTEYLHILHKYI